MTLYEFKSLKEQDQINTVWQRGVHISNRSEKEYKVLLYQIDGFYTEVYYNASTNKIEKLKSFSSTIPLEPYLKQINIKF